MRKRSLVLLAVCVAVFAAVPALAAGTWDDWKGTWTFTYNNDATDTIVFDTVCSRVAVSDPAPSCFPNIKAKDALLGWAEGKKQSDNQPVQLLKINYDPNMWGYYEMDDPTTMGAASTYDKIFPKDFTGCSFTATQNNLKVLKSGIKNNSSCSATTTTPAGGCPAQKALGDDSAALDNLRAFRDGSLAQSAVGRMIIQVYYNNADSINAALDSSPVLQSAAQSFFKAAAVLGGNQ